MGGRGDASSSCPPVCVPRVRGSFFCARCPGCPLGGAVFLSNTPSRVVGSAGGAWAVRLCEPDWPGFLPPPPRTVHAVLPHTAHRRPSPPAFGLTRQGLLALGETTVPLRLISPRAVGRPVGHD